ATRRYVRPTPWACPRWRCRTSADRSWVDSLASLGRFPSLRSVDFPRSARVGGRPPYPPSVGVPASSAGRARPSTRTVRGSRQVVAYHLPPTTYHLPLTTYYPAPSASRNSEAG